MAMTDSVVSKLALQFKTLFMKTSLDSSTTAAEKDSCKSAMERMAAKYANDMDFDFITGIAGRKGYSSQDKANAAKKAEAAKEAAKAAAKKVHDAEEAKEAAEKAAKANVGKQAASSNTGHWTTKELAAYLSSLLGKEMTAKSLRRILRANWYNDGVNTHYSWTGKDDAKVKEIVAFIVGNQKATA